MKVIANRFDNKVVCPHCGEILGKRHSSALKIFFIVLLCLAVFFWFVNKAVFFTNSTTYCYPIVYMFIRHLGFDNPKIPNVGAKTEDCVFCSKPYETECFSLDELDRAELFTYRFRYWFRVCYVLAFLLCRISAMYLFSTNVEKSSFAAKICLVLLIVIFFIIVFYRFRLSYIKKQKNKKHC